MRRLTTLAAIGLMAMITAPSRAAARTSNAICKVACAPRIAEQCAGLSGAELHRCPRPIIKACKKTTPAIGCPTTSEVTATLAGRVVRTVDPNPTDITLCDSGRFSLLERLANPAPDDPGVVRATSGAWAVRIVGAGLGLVLADDSAQAPLRLDHDPSGTLLVDGAPASLAAAGTACASAAVNPAGADRLVIVSATRAVTDRTLVIGTGSDADELTLCSSGLFVQGTESSPDTIEGTWTIDVSSGEPRLRLARENALTPIFGLGFRADGAILVDDVPVTQRDARAECTIRDFEDRLTAALKGTAFFFVTNGTIPVRTKLGLCDSGRYRLDQTSTEHGNWRVAVSASGADLELVKDGTQTVRRFPVGFDANGGIRVNGSSPIDEPSLVDAACAG
jgi:hypothetical protein